MIMCYNIYILTNAVKGCYMFLLYKETTMQTDEKISHYFKSIIGLEQLINATWAQTNTNYPPYNIINYDNSVYTIILAVAGFKKSDISVELTGSRLVVKGKRSAEPLPVNHFYMHQSLALRDFEKSFSLSENIEISSAALEDGLLTIILNRITPSTTLTRQIEIN